MQASCLELYSRATSGWFQTLDQEEVIASNPPSVFEHLENLLAVRQYILVDYSSGRLMQIEDVTCDDDLLGIKGNHGFWVVGKPLRLQVFRNLVKPSRCCAILLFEQNSCKPAVGSVTPYAVVLHPRGSIFNLAEKGNSFVLDIETIMKTSLHTGAEEIRRIYYNHVG